MLEFWVNGSTKQVSCDNIDNYIYLEEYPKPKHVNKIEKYLSKEDARGGGTIPPYIISCYVRVLSLTQTK